MHDSLPVEYGNAADVPTAGTGWFIGFSDWARQGPFALRHVPADQPVPGVCAKWYHHAAGDPNGEDKPLSTGRTVSLLVSPQAEFRLEFSRDPRFAPAATQVVTLRRCGDFAIWGAGIYHRAFGITPACILTLRWGAYG